MSSLKCTQMQSIVHEAGGRFEKSLGLNGIKSNPIALKISSLEKYLTQSFLE